MNPPHDADYHFVKSIPWGWDEIKEEQWFSSFDEGDDIYLKGPYEKPLLWMPTTRKWIECPHSIAEIMEAAPRFKRVVSPDIMAEATVKMAKILREYGIDECRFNESLNCLQYAVVKEYLHDWASQPTASQSGAYEYWEAAHRRAGITRDSNASSSS